MHPKLYSMPTSEQIAGLVPGDGSMERDIMIFPRGHAQVHMDATDPLFDPLHFVLPFPRGEYGWGKRTYMRKDGCALLSWSLLYLNIVLEI